MGWMEILSAVFLVAMLVFLFPRMKDAVKNSPKGSMEDWMSFVVPALLVVGFVLLLMSTM